MSIIDTRGMQIQSAPAVVDLQSALRDLVPELNGDNSLHHDITHPMGDVRTTVALATDIQRDGMEQLKAVLPLSESLRDAILLANETSLLIADAFFVTIAQLYPETVLDMELVVLPGRGLYALGEKHMIAVEYIPPKATLQ